MPSATNEERDGEERKVCKSTTELLSQLVSPQTKERGSSCRDKESNVSWGRKSELLSIGQRGTQNGGGPIKTKTTGDAHQSSGWSLYSTNEKKGRQGGTPKWPRKGDLASYDYFEWEIGTYHASSRTPSDRDSYPTPAGYGLLRENNHKFGGG